MMTRFLLCIKFSLMKGGARVELFSSSVIFSFALLLLCTVILSIVMLGLPKDAFAGSLDSPGAPEAGSGMPTLTDIYNQLDTGAVSTPAASFQEPASGPTAGTGWTLTQIKDKLPAPDNVSGAARGDVLTGKTFWGLRTDGTWGLITGTLSSQGDISGADGSKTFSIPDGYYSGRTATANDSDLTSGNIRSGVSIFGVSGSSNVVDTSGATATISDILSGKTAYVNGILVTGNLASQGDISGADGSKTFSIPDGYYSGRTATANDSDLTSGNIKIGVTILGVTGNFTGYTCDCSGCSLSPLGRWCDNNNGTVRDMTTGLIWLRDAGWGGQYPFWANTMGGTNAHDRAAQAKQGTPALLTDGSREGDWRLPTKRELVDLTTGTEAVSSSAMYKFLNVQAYYYWSSTTYANYTGSAWVVYMWSGVVDVDFKVDFNYVWPVRAGQ